MAWRAFAPSTAARTTRLRPATLASTDRGANPGGRCGPTWISSAGRPHGHLAAGYTGAKDRRWVVDDALASPGGGYVGSDWYAFAGRSRRWRSRGCLRFPCLGRSRLRRKRRDPRLSSMARSGPQSMRSTTWGLRSTPALTSQRRSHRICCGRVGETNRHLRRSRQLACPTRRRFLGPSPRQTGHITARKGPRVGSPEFALARGSQTGSQNRQPKLYRAESVWTLVRQK